MGTTQKINCIQIVRNKLLLFFLLLAISSSIIAQPKFSNAIRLTTDEGLVDNHVYEIVEGKHGFIWMGTGNGLSRFDGSHFKNYQNDPEKSNSLLYNSISKILPTEDRIWTATGQGLSVLDIQTDTFVNYSYNWKGERFDTIPKDHLQMTTLYQDSRGDIWCGTRNIGFGKYNKEKNDIDFFQYEGEKYIDIIANPAEVHTIMSIMEDNYNDSIMWFGASQGLLKFNRYSEEIDLIFFPHPDKQIETDLNQFRRIYQHDSQLIYTGNWSPKINVIDPENETISPLPLKENSTHDIEGITNFTRKNETEFWITSSQGLDCYNIENQEFTFSKRNKIYLNRYYGATLIDKNNRFWIHAYNGAYSYDPVLQQFALLSYRHLNTESWGFARKTILNGQDLVVLPQAGKGIYHFNRTTEKWTESAIPEKFYSNGKRFASTVYMVKSPWGDYTINSLSSLFSYNPTTKEFKEFPFQPELNYKNIRRILWDTNGRLWITATRDGLIRWDPKTGESRNFQFGLDAEGEAYKAINPSELFEDSQQNIWLKRDKGFSIYLAEKDTIINFLHPKHKGNPFTSIDFFAEDNQGRVWISGPKGFVGMADIQNPEKGIIRQFDLKIFDPSIRWFARMRTDLNGDLWLLSNNNLIKFNTNDFQCSLYSFDYGIKDREFFSFDFLATGEMVIGLRGAIVVVDPNDLQENKELPQPYVTELNVLDKTYSGDTSATMLKSLSLRHWENFFSFDFSAKGFTLPERIKYHYRLKNFSDEWIDAKDRRNANYTNVPGGDYVFQLQAANNEGIWNPSIYELKVCVATPWWQSWWFQLLALILLSGIIYSIYRYRVLEVRREERLRSDYEKQLANVEMNALRAQMNPHFLFNCLNSIDSYIIKNETKKASEYLNKFARLIRLILQNSRSNYVNLKDELESLDLYMSMESLRFRNKFDYEINVAEEIDLDQIDIPPMLIQPFIENAIWHGLMHISDTHRGKVALNFEKENGVLNCIVEDNGIGREKSTELKKMKVTGRKKSMGMRITQDRIEMINKLYDSNTSVKIIDLKNEKGGAAGTRVELNIPV